jgi:hypothetical protein
MQAFPRRAWERGQTYYVLVCSTRSVDAGIPTQSVGTRINLLCPRLLDAERRCRHSHAERGNEECLHSHAERGNEDIVGCPRSHALRGNAC